MSVDRTPTWQERADKIVSELWPAVTADERKSRAYAFLGDRTSQPDGSDWDHDRLRSLVNDLLKVI